MSDLVHQAAAHAFPGSDSNLRTPALGNALRVPRTILLPLPGICCDASATVAGKVRAIRHPGRSWTADFV